MSKYAEGPWFLDFDSDIKNHVAISSPEHGALAQVVIQWEDEEESCPTLAANARLIASAPELLEGLQTVLGILRKWQQVNPVEDARWISELIEKATGEKL